MAILAFVAIGHVADYTSTSLYCGSKCHEMTTAYQSWKLSPHGTNTDGITVDCIDCHLPPKEKYFTHLAQKAYVGAKDIYKHNFGPEYDLEQIRKKVLDHMSNDVCLYCHDNLLAKPSTAGTRLAHIVSINNPDIPTAKCTACHENTGHERQAKIFSP
jgi:cytochrome c-type protein NapC/trimethylamine-N-oxide reductase cytochrome c-type subunit TorC